MRDTIAALFNKAERAIQTARGNMRMGDPAAAVNRAYFAAFYAASAALLQKGESPKTHNVTHTRFHHNFIDSGDIDPPTGDILASTFDLRQRADYEAITILDEAAASDLIEDVRRFVDAVEEIVRKRS